jgi:hypothetical protein
MARDRKTAEAYCALPAKVAPRVVRQVVLAWQSDCAACQAWEVDSARFLGHPRRPTYRAKQGRTLLTSTEQAISRAPKHRGYVVPAGRQIRVQTRQTAIDPVRIVPQASHDSVEVIYARSVTPADGDPARVFTPLSTAAR